MWSAPADPMTAVAVTARAAGAFKELHAMIDLQAPGSSALYPAEDAREQTMEP